MTEIKATRTQKTEAAYFKLGEQLRKRATNEWGEQITVAEFIEWVIHLKPTISRSTWRQYKSSVITWLRVTAKTNGIDLDSVINDFEKITSTGCVQKTIKGPAKKLKRFPGEDFLQIIEALEKSRSKYAHPLRSWLQTGYLTGLRPAEWAGSCFEWETDTESPSLS